MLAAAWAVQSQATALWAQRGEAGSGLSPASLQHLDDYVLLKFAYILTRQGEAAMADGVHSLFF